MNKKILIIMNFFLINTCNPIEVENIKLPGYRIRDLVICNDASEIQEYKFPRTLPWSITPNDIGAISYSLLEALCANQLIICTKSLWSNLQYFKNLWHDFATKNNNFLYQKYWASSELSPIDFMKQLNIYKPAIHKINNSYEIINQIIAQNSHKSLKEISNQIKLEINSLFESDEIWIKDKDTYLYLIVLYSFYSFYLLALESQYICKNIPGRYILFIPQTLINPSKLDSNITNVTNQNNITAEDIDLGLCYTKYEEYNYKTSSDPFSDDFSKTPDLGKYLLEALNDLIIKKTMLKNQFQDYGSEILPFFNIFLTGHGTEYTTAAISIDKTQHIKNYKNLNKETNLEKTEKYSYTSSNFLEILNLFNNQLFIKSLTISSCYPGGKKIPSTFDISSKLNSLHLEKLTYPIITIGSTYAPVFSASEIPILTLPPFQENDLSAYIYVPQKKYGPSNTDLFSKFFDLLNKETQDYQIHDSSSKIPVTKNFTNQQSNFVQAANVFAEIYDETTQTINENNLNNYILIKFPHTSWFTPASFKKQVLVLSEITAKIKKQIIVSQEIQAILLESNRIDASIIFQHQSIPIFIPLNYLNQNYVFESITIKKSIPLQTFIDQFFRIEELTEPINFVIKKLEIDSKIYTNVYIFISNNSIITQTSIETKKEEEDILFKTINLGPKNFNGYLYTDSSNKTTITYCPTSNCFTEGDIITTTFETSKATEFINNIIKDSKNINNSSEHDTSYETDTSATGSNIKNLDEVISHLKTQNIAKLQQKKERDAQNEPKEKRPVHESQAAKNAAKKGQLPDPRNTLITALELASLLI